MGKGSNSVPGTVCTSLTVVVQGMRNEEHTNLESHPLMHQENASQTENSESQQPPAPMEAPNPAQEAAAPQAPPGDDELKSLLRRATGPRFLAVYLAVLVLVILALGAYIAVLKSSQCPDPQAHATGVASRAENPQAHATGVGSRAENPQAHATGVASRAENVKNSEVLPPCGDEWIWFRKKCYFFSQVEANWDAAEHACASWKSSLAVIDNQREMDFMMRYNGKFDHWIGLRRDYGQHWIWVNGSEFNNWFQIKDVSDYAFLDHDHVGSAERHNVRNWICSH
ncbi:C-type lectin domain family 7 member A-like [Ambystoma mexicanum]|uniref:C-type lectin domain family 7 member A-like n=1 Tax=Ambystoma mexicanum TaxID=8296 RepID=UPI0037E7002E